MTLRVGVWHYSKIAALLTLQRNMSASLPNPGEMWRRGTRILQNLREQAAKLKREEHALRAAELEVRRVVQKETRSVVDVSVASVVKSTLAIFGLLALAWLLLQISQILILFFIAAFVAVAFNPIVDWLQRYRVPRGLGILLIYTVFIGAIGIVISSFIPILTTEIPNLARQVLDWLQSSFGVDTTVIREQLNQIQNYLGNIQQNLQKEDIQAGLAALGTATQNAVAIIKSVAGGLFSFVMVLVIAFFMTIEEDGIKRFLLALFPARFHGYIIEKATAVEDKFGSWLRGQLLLMLAIGVVTFIALKIAGVNYAATLATFAGLMELIPYVGPFLALLPAVIIAASQGGFWLAAVMVAVYVGIQQLEGNVLVPLVMEKTVGLSPVVVMFAMLVGASFPDFINPVVGIILSVPVATAISVFVQDYAERKK